jgi:threonyl-tRNA synthetase
MVFVKVDVRNEKFGYKIREAQLSKVPYMLVLGDNGKTNKILSVRKRGEGDLGKRKVQVFVERINQEVQLKLIN